MNHHPLGVGIIGAGPVTQAIHLPTLATLADRLRVVHVMDVDATVAAAVADRAAARATTAPEEILADPAVDVVAICSPHQFHAEQIAAATTAGKRGILCEKPLATTVDEAQRIADISTTSGVPIVVGAMHAYDPAWVAARPQWQPLTVRARLVRSTIFIPPNDEFIDLATDLVAPPATPPRPAERTTQIMAQQVRGGVLGLATHAIPQIRQFLPTIEQVTAARSLRPFGYQLVATGDGRTAELLALMPGRWSPDWTFEAWSADGNVRVEYPPSYVLAGSATVTANGRSWHYPTNGYQAEWIHLADVVEGRAELAIPVHTAVDELMFALDLADRAVELILEDAWPR